MPRPCTKKQLAVFKFFGRCLVSSRFRDVFRNDFSRFEAYPGAGALRDQKQSIKTVLECNECIGGFDHIHGHLHDLNVLPLRDTGKAGNGEGGCEEDCPDKKSRLSTISLVCGSVLAVLAAERLVVAVRSMGGDDAVGLGVLSPTGVAAIALPVVALLAAALILIFAQREAV